jgi:plastocyanin
MGLSVAAGLALAGLAGGLPAQGGSAVAAPAAQQTVEVQMLAGPVRFEPAEITISPGTTVTWITGSGSHTTTSETGVWDSGEQRLPVGESFTFTFTTPGEYDYYCTPHRDTGMVGKVIVR